MLFFCAIGEAHYQHSHICRLFICCVWFFTLELRGRSEMPFKGSPSHNSSVQGFCLVLTLALGSSRMLCSSGRSWKSSWRATTTNQSRLLTRVLQTTPELVFAVTLRKGPWFRCPVWATLLTVQRFREAIPAPMLNDWQAEWVPQDKESPRPFQACGKGICFLGKKVIYLWENTCLAKFV